ncbi:MAG TPA: fatty acid desaturase, partial [Pirellulales bacterium]|nr:fatty acid desaturase [Pirellulales bacterium]
LVSAAYLVSILAAAATWSAGLWPLTLVIWVAAGCLGHAKLIAFHESAHGTLSRRRWLNELQGIGVGTIILVPLSAYRWVHAQHHAQLGTQHDLELWPFVDPRAPRWLRLAATAAELLLGFFYTPLVFLRGVLRATGLPIAQQARIVAEYSFCAAVWGGLLWVIARQQAWTLLAVGYLVPASLAAAAQTLRKFTEHMGLLDEGVLSTTRTVVDQRPLGQALSRSLLHIDHHGTHHRYAKIPYYNLPAATPLVYASAAERSVIFSSYLQALLDMLPTLANPRIGRQWLAHDGAPCGQVSAPARELV